MVTVAVDRKAYQHDAGISLGKVVSQQRPACLSTRLPCLTIWLSVCLSVCLSLCLSVCSLADRSPFQPLAVWLLGFLSPLSLSMH
jgi:hypothetical protein